MVIPPALSHQGDMVVGALGALFLPNATFETGTMALARH